MSPMLRGALGDDGVVSCDRCGVAATADPITGAELHHEACAFHDPRTCFTCLGYQAGRG